MKGAIILIVFNQDRDSALTFGLDQELYAMPAVGDDGKLNGINLMCDKTLLGTFDTVLEAADEITRILEARSKEEKRYCVSGYDMPSSEMDYLLDAMDLLADN